MRRISIFFFEIFIFYGSGSSVSLKAGWQFVPILDYTLSKSNRVVSLVYKVFFNKKTVTGEHLKILTVSVIQ